MKFRKGSHKVKKQHSLIPGLRKLLESIEHWEEISAVTPGEINRSRGSSSLRLTIQYTTPAGVRCLAKGGASVQEVFFVSSQTEKLMERLRALGES